MINESVRESHMNRRRHEIMLMATTMVAVVIVRSGDMVGRGVPPRSATEDVQATATSAAVDPTVPVTDATESTAPTRTTGTSDVPVTTQDTLTYAERLEAPTPPRETMKEIADPPGSAKAPASVAVAPPGDATNPRQFVRSTS